MTNSQKREALASVEILREAHEEIKSTFRKKDSALLQDMLAECQKLAVALGEYIEKFEGEGHVTVLYLEEYCEVLFQIHVQLADNLLHESKVYKILNKQLLKIENSIKNDIPAKIEIVFFPYKASMWDSLESVYLAARADPDCEVYCVPIPYYDLDTDRNFREMHYEGKDYPDYVEITDWQAYDFENRKPDVAYIHSPYDDWNLVTSVHPRYYSSNIKKYVGKLVYIPYYSTSGGMSEAQRLCPAYVYADYIVIQSPELRTYFDERIPDSKFLPFGSPKFDRIIQKCQAPPKPPKEWKMKMEGRKVYFYNTSIGGMLGNTKLFLKKLQYVFSCFEGRKDVCLLWRPHPLLESTFDSMRPEYKPRFDALKKDFIEKDFGIYDTTPDMADAIALSDVYIGDSSSSLVSLFGIVGKPIFILNNRLHSAPKEDSWRGEVNVAFNYLIQHRYTITQGNKLYASGPFQYDYHFLCNLSEYAYGDFYSTIQEIHGKLYACPRNAEHILVIGKNGVEKKIELEKRVAKDGIGAFVGAGVYEDCLWLCPFRYPAIVFYNTINGEITYLEDHIDVFVKEDDSGKMMIGGVCLREEEGCLYLASPTDNYVYKLDIKRRTSQVIELPVKSRCGCHSIREIQGELWMLPFNGKTIVRWNPDTGAVWEYLAFPEEYVCIDPIYEFTCEKRPFGSCALYGHELYLAPCWGNMFVKLNIKTGEARQWHPPFDIEVDEEYYFSLSKAIILWNGTHTQEENIKIYINSTRKLYALNLRTNESTEIEIKFDVDELKRNEPGFCEDSKQLKYSCHENAFNSLTDLLDNKISGNQFDRERQLKAYQKMTADRDGNCGKKIYEFISKQIP